MNLLTLIASFHSTNDATPSIHNTLPKGYDIVVHLVARLRSSGDRSCLLENLRND